MNDCRPLLLALVVLGGGCTAIVDAGSYEFEGDGGRGPADAEADGGDAGDARVVDAARPDASDAAPDAGPDDDARVEETPPGVDLVKLAATVNALATWACINVSRCEGRLGGEAAARGAAVRFCHPGSGRARVPRGPPRGRGERRDRLRSGQGRGVRRGARREQRPGRREQRGLQRGSLRILGRSVLRGLQRDARGRAGLRDRPRVRVRPDMRRKRPRLRRHVPNAWSAGRRVHRQ